MTTQALCDLDDGRARRASIRVVVTSNRVDRPGRPMVRELLLCPTHARALRQLGIEVIASS